MGGGGYGCLPASLPGVGQQKYNDRAKCKEAGALRT
jgi:hypothetical protein